MASHPDPSRAGLPALPGDLVDVAELVTAYYTRVPDPSVASQRVAFGTSGHRGSALSTSFNEAHIVATTQAICEYRTAQGIDGPLFLGADSHALSAPATATALEVLAANGVRVLLDSSDRFVPTPALSRAIVAWNTEGLGGADAGTADGIVVTPSHNPPRDGGFKYNPPDGGPAGTEITGPVQQRANDLLAAGFAAVARVRYEKALRADTTGRFDYLDHYVSSLPRAIDLEAIAASGLRIGADPLGGASVDYWGEIGERHGLALTVVNPHVDRTFGFMTLDWDGRIRMDCSSPSAMAGLIDKLTDSNGDYDLATGNDTDADRHGVVTPDAGLMNPNHFLAAAIAHLYAGRDGWSAQAAVGKTMVSSSMIDRVVADLGRELYEVPVGFKWFVPGLRDGKVAFGGEESAGASFLTRDGGVWTTDKDGILLDLLASEMTAVHGSTPSQQYAALTERFGAPEYARVDAPATPDQKAALGRLSAEQVTATELAGDAIEQRLTAAPGNGAALGGLKVVTANGWFAARPSGTEDVYKLYAESFLGADHLAQIQAEARELVSSVLEG